MKRISTCFLAGLLLLGTVFFLSPPLGVFATREEPQVCIDDSFATSKLSVDKTNGIGKNNYGKTVTKVNSLDKYYLLQPKATLIQGFISDGEVGYLPIEAYSASFRGTTLFSQDFAIEEPIDKTAFVFEIDFPKIETKYAIEASIRFDHGYFDEYGNLESSGALRSFIDIKSSGDVFLSGHDEPLFNLKDGAHQLALSFRYSDEETAYLVTAYVNDAVCVIDSVWKPIASDAALLDFIENETKTFSALDVNGGNRIYGTFYNETDDPYYEGLPIYEASSSHYPDAFDDGASSCYSLAIDRIYNAFGTCTPTHLKGSSAEYFSAYGGAAIRPANAKESAGLRFAFGIDKTYYQQISRDAESIEIGAYIIPEDYLQNGLLDSEVVEQLLSEHEILQVTASEFSESEDVTTSDRLGFYASIVDLKEYNYARAFRAIGYLKIDGRVYYSSASESRSANEVARRIAASGELDGRYAEMKEMIVETYLDTVAILDEACKPIATSGYDAPYRVTVSGKTTLSVTIESIDGFDLSRLKTIVIDGVLYNTKGCDATMSGETVSALSFNYTIPTK